MIILLGDSISGKLQALVDLRGVKLKITTANDANTRIASTFLTDLWATSYLHLPFIKLLIKLS